MLRDNPYEATGTTEAVSGRVAFPVKTVLWWLVFLHPVITMTLIYGCWGLTTASLGRPPAFGEHPSNDAMHTLVHAVGGAAMLSLLAGPALVPIGALWSLAQPFAS